MTIERVLQQVADERARQDARWGAPAERGLCAETWLAILGEEIGEVCRAALPAEQGRGGDLRHELVQVAAVCRAHAEAVDEARTWDEWIATLAASSQAKVPPAWLGTLLLYAGEVARLETYGPPRALRGSWHRLGGLAVAWAAALDPDPTKE